jgi:hypothetical protein
MPKGDLSDTKVRIFKKIEEARDLLRHHALGCLPRGEFRVSSLVKWGKNTCLLLRGKRFFFYIYEVIVKQKTKKSLYITTANHYWGSPSVGLTWSIGVRPIHVVPH